MSEFTWSDYSVRDTEELARQSAVGSFNLLAANLRGEIDENGTLAANMDGFSLPAAPSIPECDADSASSAEASLRRLRDIAADYRQSINKAVRKYAASLDAKDTHVSQAGVYDMLRRDQVGLAMEVEIRRGKMSAQDVRSAQLQHTQQAAVDYIGKSLGDGDLPPIVKTLFDTLVNESDPSLANVRLESLMSEVDAAVSLLEARQAESARSKEAEEARLVAGVVADVLRQRGYEVSGIEVEGGDASRMYGIEGDQDARAVEFRFDHDRKTLTSELVRIAGQDSEETPEGALVKDRAAVDSWCGEHGHALVKQQLAERGVELKHDGMKEWGGQKLKVSDSPALASTLRERRRKSKFRRSEPKKLRTRTRSR